jgi:ABC-type dipeptide/oligopeptide/nickel transport system permease component
VPAVEAIEFVLPLAFGFSIKNKQPVCRAILGVLPYKAKLSIADSFAGEGH